MLSWTLELLESLLSNLWDRREDEEEEGEEEEEGKRKEMSKAEG